MLYVDRLRNNGMIVRGRQIRTCHLWSDKGRDELLQFAESLGMPRSWLHDGSILHFDLVRKLRGQAVLHGAVGLGDHAAAVSWERIRKRNAITEH